MFGLTKVPFGDYVLFFLGFLSKFKRLAGESMFFDWCGWCVGVFVPHFMVICHQTYGQARQESLETTL